MVSDGLVGFVQNKKTITNAMNMTHFLITSRAQYHIDDSIPQTTVICGC